MGRRAGSSNKGYFYRSGRGWYATVGKGMTSLRDDDGNHLRDKSTPVVTLKAAHRKIIANVESGVNTEDPPSDVNDGDKSGNGVTVQDVCIAYLNKVFSDGGMTTWKDRAATLVDFCLGFPPRSCEKDEQGRILFHLKKDAKPSDRIHNGYGQVLASNLRPDDIDQWLAAHKNWKNSKRTRIQAVKRAFSYGVNSGLIAKDPGSPLNGYKVPRSIPRVTYITPEQEQAIYTVTNPQFAMAVKVCIRTGARPGKEFAKLTDKHVTEHGNRMEWTFAAREQKTGKATGKKRIIRITDPEIINIVRQQIAKHPNGAIFRNTRGSEWTRKALDLSFRKAKQRLAVKGISLDSDAVMYSCRHTYAKRTLQGYWTGKMTNIETLALLMGNRAQTCRDHYLQWTDTYEEPLWQSA